MLRPVLLTILANALALCPAMAAPLERATFTEVVNSVSVLDPGTKQSRPARTRELFAVPQVLRTGRDSRAELVADDQTVTRVGANTVFSFQPGSRTIELEKGSILFQSPSGKGGGSIRTSAASAAVLGTTLIVAATRDGGMKVLLLEGRGKVVLPGGKAQVLGAGQMTMILPGNRVSPVIDFQLAAQTESARLLKGFRTRLPSAIKIAQATREQQRQVQSGRLIPRDRRPLPRDDARRPLDGNRPPPPPPPLLRPGTLPPPPQPGLRDTATQVQQQQQAQKAPPPPPPPPRGSQPPPPRR